MAAHSYIRVGDELLFACRESYISEFAAMYRDTELITSLDEPIYSLPLPQLCERLDVLGFDVDTCKRRISGAFREARMYDQEVQPIDDWLDDYQAAISRTDVEPWNNGLEDVPGWAAWAGDPRVLLRLILDRSPLRVSVALDVSEVVSRGYAPTSPTLCGEAYARVHAEVGVFAPRIVLTEGTTDAEFLEGSLRLLMPHLDGFVRFFDWEFRPEGSTSGMVRAVRAFAAAGVSNQVVALFDSDTAAADALRTPELSRLPPNFRVVQLPELEWARCYPTLGPTGLADLDINGLAVSIELFFGQDVLRNANGDLSPVQWTGHFSKLGRYQGEVTAKPRLQNAFRGKLNAALARGAASDVEDWSDMRRALRALVDAFAPADMTGEAAQLATRECLGDTV